MNQARPGFPPPLGTRAGATLIERLAAITPEQLLGRELFRCDSSLLGRHIQGKVVMVTGAAGSVGSELCRRIGALGPAALVGFDLAETPLFLLDRELRLLFPGLTFHPLLGSVARFNDVCWALERHRPSILFHAAAYKHVSMMQRNIAAAVENNILGTWQVARALASQKTAGLVLISTDKAVRPACVMGATKRVAELAVLSMQRQHGAPFVVVRFGNVLGSMGNVLPIFQHQIATGGPLTVTHAEMQRYFMTASEAAELVLASSLLGRGGETFLFDMGKPVRILDLAVNLVRCCGLEPGRDIEIRLSGVQPGEKLREDLHLEGESLVATMHPRIKRLVSNQDRCADPIPALMQELGRALETRDEGKMMHLLREAVPEYAPGSYSKIIIDESGAASPKC